MPILKNSRWESFAKYKASGKSRHDAYVAAGFNPKNRKNATGAAHQLMQNPDIVARITEWEEEIASHSAAAEGLSRDYVVEQLIENVEMAKVAKPVLDRQGKETGEYQSNLAAANRALELLGKEKGMFVDRIHFEGLDAELAGMEGKVLRDFIRGVGSEVGLRMVDMTDDDTRGWILRNAERVGLRVVAESGEDPDGSEDAEDGGVPPVSEAAGVPPTRH